MIWRGCFSRWLFSLISFGTVGAFGQSIDCSVLFALYILIALDIHRLEGIWSHYPDPANPQEREDGEATMDIAKCSPMGLRERGRPFAGLQSCI